MIIIINTAAIQNHHSTRKRWAIKHHIYYILTSTHTYTHTYMKYTYTYVKSRGILINYYQRKVSGATVSAVVFLSLLLSLSFSLTQPYNKNMCELYARSNVDLLAHPVTLKCTYTYTITHLLKYIVLIYKIYTRVSVKMRWFCSVWVFVWNLLFVER